jgi:hypothetical protein
MIVYEKNGKIIAFIHIPKNSGTYIREQILKDTNNNILNSFWGISKRIDIAHIPFILKNNYINYNIDNYYTYVRNPYHRLISAYLYKNNINNKINFKFLIKEKLINFKFNLRYSYNIIHFYPQYLFLINKLNQIKKDIKIIKIEEDKDLNPHYYNLSDYYDKETFEIVNKIYAKDFELFNYEKY